MDNEVRNIYLTSWDLIMIIGALVLAVASVVYFLITKQYFKPALGVFASCFAIYMVVENASKRN